jgi:phosphoribosylanthranilate isomerase
MASVKVKICGITNWTDARHAVEGGADLVGFNFYKGSPRYISPAKARRIARRLPKRISVVGIFVNETEEKTLEIARAVGLDYLQLSGEESPEMVARLARSIPVIKGVRVKKPFRAAQLAPFTRASALLLDGFHGRLRGGTGKTFDWAIARRARRYGRIFLAGGLTPENVAKAIRRAKPYAVDVCSGVESKPGTKDPKRLRDFLRAAGATHKRTR